MATPGRSRPPLIDQAKTLVKNTGPTSPAMAISPALAPCSRPWRSRGMRRVITPCTPGMTSPAMAPSGTPHQYIQGCAAEP